MECRAQEIANVLLVQVEGRIDHTVAKVFEDALLPLLDGGIAGGKKAVLDLGGVAYMSSAGLRVLTLAAKQCRKQHGEMVIAALQPLLQERGGQPQHRGGVQIDEIGQALAVAPGEQAQARSPRTVD